MDYKTWIKQKIERFTDIRIYRYSLPRGVDFTYDTRDIIDPKKVSVVFDVGANVGQSAEKFRDTYPNARIFCFEPVSSTYQELKRRVSKYERIETFKLAFGNIACLKSIHINPDPTSMVNSFINDFTLGMTEVVKVQTLDDFCIENKIENIDLLKIDAEGFEMEVLKGADRMLSNNRVKSLYLEAAPRFNDDHCFVTLNQLDQQLAPYGYSIFGIYEQEMDRFRNFNYCCFFNVAYVVRTLCERSNDK